MAKHEISPVAFTPHQPVHATCSGRVLANARRALTSRRRKLTWVFAWLGQYYVTPPGWPVQLMQQTEKAFVVVAVACLVVGVFVKRPSLAVAIAFVGSISAGITAVMPFELAP